jgi:outer membrane protein
MKFSRFMLAIASIFFLQATLTAAPSKAPFGVVNFSTCIFESKYGKQEQEGFESVKAQMTNLIEDMEKQINEITEKFNDPDYMDSLAPEAEAELKAKYQSMMEEHGRYQNQFYQVMNQVNMKLIQTMSNHINQASETVAKNQQIPLVINKESCFFYDEKYDITSAVIDSMDKTYEVENKDKKKPTNVEVSKEPLETPQGEKK